LNRPICIPGVWLVAACFLACGIMRAAEMVPRLEAVQVVAGFYAEHCVRCHKEGKAKGGFRLDELLAKPTVEGFDDPWRNVLEKLSGREMPPMDEEKRPSHEAYETQIRWLRGELEKSEQRTASARPRAQRRLNRAEYNRTVSDLFGVPLRPADAFPPDDALHGFNTVAEGLNTSTVLLEQYLAAAHDIAAAVTRAYDVQPPERKVLRVVMNTQDPPGFRLFNPNALVRFGDPRKPWENRQWVGNSWGYDQQVHAPGFYTLTLRGKPRGLEPGERVILRLDVHGRRVGVFDSGIPTAGVADPPLLQARVWLEPVRFYSEASAAFTFTYVNGNPFGTAVGETEDYHGSCWQAFVDFRARRFPGLKENPGDDWMPSEPPDLPVRRIADVELEIVGPEPGAWPPVGFQRAFEEALKKEDLRGLLSGFLPLAWRRPVTAEEVAGIEAFSTRAADPSGGFVSKVQAALTRILVAPEFLFLVERVPPGTPRGDYRLTDWELAARLSYFLTGTLPDAELRTAAGRGELRDATRLAAQVDRLLRDPRCVDALTEGFLNLWLQLDRLAGVMPEPKLFPRFGDDLKRSAAEEPKAFFAALLRENGKITDFLDARYTWANERLAMHYGMDRKSIRGSGMRRVELANPQRGGLLGMAGVLTLTSEATRTSPVKRGSYILETLFHRPPPPPPPNVGDLIPNTASARSIREHLVRHREDAACAGCHSRIDPWGLALENYDAVGAWRTQEAAWEDPSRADPSGAGKGNGPRTFPIDVRFELPIQSEAAKRLDGPEAVRAELLHRRDDFARGFTEKMMIYALGRGLVMSDHRSIESAVEALKQGNYRLHALIHAVVQSAAFQTR
jgi:Protein of unknown function (DUF1592)/Protein of unknown function (DUF1588)/Protein of unknown function (DUF1587)/Protein of unknown function (DUF1585)/Protein of unknown function (DUF1595)